MTGQTRKKDWWPAPLAEPPVNGITLEPMTMDHLDVVVELEIESFPVPWSREAFDYDMEKNHLAHYWIMVRDETIIGYAGIWLVGDIAHLTTICIQETWRGKGLGRWLLLNTMLLGEKLGARRFTLEVREKNESIIKLYESVGYREVGRRTNYYKEIGEDAVVMWTGSPPFEK